MSAALPRSRTTAGPWGRRTCPARCRGRTHPGDRGRRTRPPRCRVREPLRGRGADEHVRCAAEVERHRKRSTQRSDTAHVDAQRQRDGEPRPAARRSGGVGPTVARSSSTPRRQRGGHGPADAAVARPRQRPDQREGGGRQPERSGSRCATRKPSTPSTRIHEFLARSIVRPWVLHGRRAVACAKSRQFRWRSYVGVMVEAWWRHGGAMNQFHRSHEPISSEP